MTMVPSHLMRAGRKRIARQAFGVMFQWDARYPRWRVSNLPNCACASGAMALGWGYAGPFYAATMPVWPDGVANPESACPACKTTIQIPSARDYFTGQPTAHRGAYASEVVVHLNDDHRWTIGRIARWLEALGL